MIMSNFFKKKMNKLSPSPSFLEPGISPAEKRRRAMIQARNSNRQGGEFEIDLKISRNYWCGQIYGSLANAPLVWRKGAY